MEDYGLALKILRRHFKLTQREVADRVGVSNHAISKWENGINQPDISSLRSVCAIYGITTEQFFRIASGEAIEEVLKETPETEETIEENASLQESPSAWNVPPHEPPTTGAGMRLKGLILGISITAITVCLLAVVAVALLINGAKGDVTENSSISVENSSTISSGGASSATSSEGNNLVSVDSSQGSSSQAPSYPENVDSSQDSASSEEESISPTSCLLEYYVDGKRIKASVAEKGSSVMPEKAEKIGYVFECWKTDEGKDFDFSSVQSSQKLYAQFRPIRYTVVFQSGYGGETYTLSAQYDEEWCPYKYLFTEIEDTMVGWKDENGKLYALDEKCKNSTTVDGDTLYLTAVWTKENSGLYTVWLYGGTGVYGESTEFAEELGKPWTLPECSYTKTGYVFSHWEFDGERYDVGDEFVLSDASLLENGYCYIHTAWTPISYTVRFVFNENGVEYTDTNVCKYDQEDYCLPTLFTNQHLKEGYYVSKWKIGDAWYKSNEPVKNLASEEGAVVVATPEWGLSSYVQGVFDSGDNQSYKSFQTGIPFVLPPCNYTNAGYVFKGWKRDGKIYYPGDMYVYTGTSDTIRFNATWGKITYYVEYTSELHEGTSRQTCLYDSTYCTYALPLASWGEFDGYELVGFTINGRVYGLGEEFKNLSATHGAVVKATAIWDRPSAAVYDLWFESGFDDGGEFPTEHVTLSQNGRVTLPNCTYNREGYTFTGWDYGGKTYSAGESFSADDLDFSVGDVFFAKWYPIHFKVVYYSELHEATSYGIYTYDGLNRLDSYGHADWDVEGLTIAGWEINGVEYALFEEIGNLTSTNGEVFYAKAIWKEKG